MAKKNEDDVEVIKEDDGDVIVIDDDDGSTGKGCLFGGLTTIIIGIVALIVGGVYVYIKQDLVLDYLGLVREGDIPEEMKDEEKVVEKIEREEPEEVEEEAEEEEEDIEDIVSEEEETTTPEPVVEPESLLTDEYIEGLGTTLKPAKREVLRDRVDFIITSSEVLSSQHRQMVLGKMMYALSDDWIDSDEWEELMGLIYDYM